jgi:hypothetical protein
MCKENKFVCPSDAGILQKTMRPRFFAFMQNTVVHGVNNLDTACPAQQNYRQIPVMKAWKIGNFGLFYRCNMIQLPQEYGQPEQATPKKFEAVPVGRDHFERLFYWNGMVFRQKNQAVFEWQMVNYASRIIGITEAGQMKNQDFSLLNHILFS